jgi:outer membrane protein OmpA-like peptidoglycan-associated protein
MKLRSALLAATVLVAPVAAKAQAISGIYIGAGAGGNFVSGEKITGLSYPQRGALPIASGFGSSRLSLDGGIVGLASVGYGFGNGLRVELEGSYDKNQFNRSNHLATIDSAAGNELKYSGFVNALYDFDLATLGISAPVTPYVGVGAGYSYVQDKSVRFNGYAGPVFGYNQYETNSGQGAFAYQAIIGAAVPIAPVPGLALTLEYRFMGLEGDRQYTYQYTQSGPKAGFYTRASVKMNSDYNNSILVGVRYAFNAAPAPVVVPAAPVPMQTAARTYLVFFDWDRADLTDRAKQIIAEAAQATTKVAVTKIMVSGNTDTTGTAKYNQALSLRRAQNVAAELVRLGVPRAAITAQGFGFTRLLVPTGPGVREPQNRRVEIVLQ